jgi:murein DD-endopeptidase MepM/ murein hydrolase activator NlpD
MRAKKGSFQQKSVINNSYQWILVIGMSFVFMSCAHSPKMRDSKRSGFFDVLEGKKNSKPLTQKAVIADSSTEDSNFPQLKKERVYSKAVSPKKRRVLSSLDTPLPLEDDKKNISNDFKMQWPLKEVEILSGFGYRGRHFHEGVDLRAAMRTSVHAAHDGSVLFQGRLHGYGKVLVLRHASGVSTVYAHVSSFNVKKGQDVKMGDKIATSGQSGRATGPHLHFEIREKIQSVDPLKYLDRDNVVVRKEANLAGVPDSVSLSE